jgi:hypothetical protein
MTLQSSRRPGSNRYAWLVGVTAAGLLVLWGTFWYLLLWDHKPGLATTFCCILLTSVSVSLAVAGLALGVAEPEPEVWPVEIPAPGTRLLSGSGSMVRDSIGHSRLVRLDRAQHAGARSRRPHARFRWTDPWRGGGSPEA